MKNKFEDILNQQSENENKIKEGHPVSSPESSLSESDVLKKFKNHQKKKRNKIKLAVEEVVETLPEEKLPTHETEIASSNTLAINLDLTSIDNEVEEKEVSSTEEIIEPSTEVPSVTNEVPVEKIEEKEVVVSEESKVDIEKIEQVTPQSNKKYRLKRTESNPTPVVSVVPETPIAPVESVPVAAKNTAPKNTKKKSSVKKKSLWNKVTFNSDSKRLIPVLIGVSMLIVVLLVAISLQTGQSITDEVVVSSVSSSVITPQNEQNDVNKDSVTLLMEKAVNEDLPVNYYLLSSEYDALLKKTDFPKEGYFLIEKLMLQSSPDVVNIYNVKGREYPANSVLSTWAIKVDNAKELSLLQDNLPAIKIAIETAFFNKDQKFLQDKEAMNEVITFAIERVTGQTVVVENVLLKGDFK